MLYNLFSLHQQPSWRCNNSDLRRRGAFLIVWHTVCGALLAKTHYSSESALTCVSKFILSHPNIAMPLLGAFYESIMIEP